MSRSVLAPVTYKDAAMDPKTCDVALDARVRDMATEPRYNEKGNDPKMRDTACDAWKRDGYTQAIQVPYKPGQRVTSDKIIIPTKYKTIEESSKEDVTTEKVHSGVKQKAERRKSIKKDATKMVEATGTQYHIGERSTDLGKKSSSQRK